MFRETACPSSGVQIVTTAFGDQSWKTARVVQRWAATCVHCRATSFEQFTHLAAQRYATQEAFQGWPPNAVVTICTPDDGHAVSRNMLSQ
jgi:hypothetical protein